MQQLLSVAAARATPRARRRAPPAARRWRRRRRRRLQRRAGGARRFVRGERRRAAEQRDQVGGGALARRAREAEAVEVGESLVGRAAEGRAPAAGEAEHVVDALEDAPARLVEDGGDGEAGGRHAAQRPHHLARGARVEAARRVVDEEDLGHHHELDADAEAPPLAEGDAARVGGRAGAHARAADVRQPEHVQDAVDEHRAVGARHARRQPRGGGEVEGLLGRQQRQ